MGALLRNGIALPTLLLSLGACVAASRDGSDHVDGTRADGEIAATPVTAPGVAADPSRSVHVQLDRLTSEGFSGAVMVARDGEPPLLEGYGTADRDDQVPVTPQTIFHLGSVTKQFTAAAILKLEMEGRLRISDSIAAHLEGVPPDKRAITIHHLLTHTSGLPGRSYPCSGAEAISRDEHVRRVFAAELRSPPGTHHSYSNEGYSLLGAIIEAASGESYEQYLREHLFEPAGMTSTGYTFNESERARAARGYDGDEEFVGYLNPTETENGPAWCGRSSGALLSTAEDMYRWYVALRGSDIFSAQAKEKMFTPHVPENPEGTSFYGYGWALFTTPRGTRLVAHNGSINDYFTADLRWYVDEEVAIFVAGNTAELSATSAARAVAGALFPPRSTGVR